MRAGFVGTGGFARKHAEVAKGLGVTIAGCYSTNEAKAAHFANDFGAANFHAPAEMISRRNIDLLYIVVPPGAHDGVAEMKAIQEGVPFIVEKPVGLDLSICRSIAAEVEKSKLVTSVGYMLRESPLLPEVREVIARNKISSVRACRMAGFPDVHWWRKMSTSGGPMVEQTTHVVDLIRHVFGDARQVAAFTSSGIGASRYPDCDVFDSMEAIISFQSGAIANIGLGTTLDNGFSKVELFDAFGQDFYLSYNGHRLRYKEGKNEWVERPQSDRIDLVLELNRRFIDAVEKNDPSAVLSPYADGVKTLELTLAMNESAATGKVISQL